MPNTTRLEGKESAAADYLEPSIQRVSTRKWE